MEHLSMSDNTVNPTTPAPSVPENEAQQPASELAIKTSLKAGDGDAKGPGEGGLWDHNG